MKRTLLFAISLLTLFVAVTGCKSESKGGETVPAPPRELIEKSYQGGKMGGPPPPQPGATRPQ